MSPGALATPATPIEQTASGAAEPLAVLYALADGLQAERLTAEDIRHRLQQLAAGRRVTMPVCEALCHEAEAAVEQDPRRGRPLAEVAYHAACCLNDTRHAARAKLLLAHASCLRGDFLGSAALAAEARELFSTLDDPASAGCCDLEAASARLALGHYAEARRQLLQAAALFEQLELPPKVADARHLLARVHMEEGEYEEALLLCQQARQVYEQADDIIKMARCDLDLAAISLYQNRYAAAWELLQPLLPIFEKAGLTLDQAHTLKFMGLVHTQRNEYEQAEHALSRAQDIYTQVGNDFEVAKCERSRANVCRAQDRLPQAVDHCLRALQIFEAYGHEVAVARTAHTLGVLQYTLNRYAEAKASYEKAVEIFDKHGLRTLAAIGRHSLGLVLARQGNCHAALTAYERAREMFIEQGRPVYLAHCLESMAAVHLRLGQCEEALALARQAYDILNAEGLATDAARYALTLARACHELGDSPQALKLLSEARQHFMARGMEISVAFCDRLAADAHLAEGHLPLALSLYRETHQTFGRHGLRVEAALCRLAQGQALWQQGEDQQAAEAFQEALAELGADFPDQSWRAEVGLAQVARRQGDRRHEARHLRQAIGHLEQVRQTIATEEHASSFFARCQNVYLDALHRLLALGELEAALEVAEASKGSVLRWLLSHRASTLADAAVDDVYLRQLLHRQHTLRGEIEALRHRLYEAEPSLAAPGSLPAGPSPAQWTRDHDRLAQLGKEHAALFSQIRRAHAGYALLEAGEPFSLAHLRAEMARQFPTGWGCLIYASLQQGQLAVFYVDNETIEAWVREPDPVARLALQQCATLRQDERELIYGRTLRGYGAPKSPSGTYLRCLYEVLIPEAVRERLNPDRLLLIVPHGILHYLPFHALLDGEAADAYLIQETVLGYAPSLHVWCTLLKDRRPSAPEQEDEAPSEEKRRFRPLIVGLSTFGHRARPLLQAEEEATRLWELFEQQGDLLLGPAASRQKLLSLNADGSLRAYDLVHFATHAVFDTTAPLQSRILLRDGDLMTSDIFTLRLSAPLVTLSACQSAVSQNRPGDELLGLPQAFFFAGARSLLASLWTVNDRSTAELMRNFYQVWKRGTDPAWALAAAQRAMIEEGVAPFRWAPFLLLGIP
ncbi:MAG: CHAT domain-containing protein [Anaerolineae bacterium]|nr:CHAT domain-containing protein [Anaerolineae bacterium]